MSNSLDPDQARLFVGPDLGPNSLQMISADNTGRQRVLGVPVSAEKTQRKKSCLISLKCNFSEGLSDGIETLPSNIVS